MCVCQVLHRRALEKNRDVIEVDCWGMDCYTRRNVFDAVLEANVFKHLRDADQQQQQQDQKQQDQLQPQQQQLVKAEFEQQQQEAAGSADLNRGPAFAQPDMKEQSPAPVGGPDAETAAVDTKQLQQKEPLDGQQDRGSSPPSAAENVTSQQQQGVQQQRQSADRSSGSPESGSGCCDDGDDPQGDGEAQRKSRRARKRVMHADEAMEELKVRTVYREMY